ncbi:unnamed protein product, partial [Didymodactylos carnosus]
TEISYEAIVDRDNQHSIDSTSSSSPWITIELKANENLIKTYRENCDRWQLDSSKVSSVVICCTTQRSRDEINDDFLNATKTIETFDERFKYALVHVENYVYAIGGYKLKQGQDQTGDKILNGPMPGRTNFGLATDSKCIVIVGGLTSHMDDKSTNSVWLFEYENETWSRLCDLSRSIISVGTCFIDNYHLIVIGGLCVTSHGPLALRKCYLFNMKKNLWFNLAPLNEARGHPICTCYNKIVYAIGGIQYNLYKQQLISVTTIEQYEINLNQWTILTTIKQLKSRTGLYCTSDGIIVGSSHVNGVEEESNKNLFQKNIWAFDLVKKRLISE